jgi:hypothetical protein
MIQSECRLCLEEKVFKHEIMIRINISKKQIDENEQYPIKIRIHILKIGIQSDGIENNL